LHLTASQVVESNDVLNFRTLRDVLIYERFVSADGSVIHVHERYTDSAAAVTHLRTFGRVFSRRFGNLVVRTRFIVYGTPTAELRETLDGFGAIYFLHFGGFSR
jgi:hypothetical protein